MAVGFWIGFSRNRHRGIVTGKRRSYGYDSERRFSRPNAGKRCEVAVHKTNRKNDVAHGGVWNNRGLGSILIVFFFFSAGVDSAENYLFLFCYFFSALFIVLWSLSLLLRGPRREWNVRPVKTVVSYSAQNSRVVGQPTGLCGDEHVYRKPAPFRRMKANKPKEPDVEQKQISVNPYTMTKIYRMCDNSYS